MITDGREEKTRVDEGENADAGKEMNQVVSSCTKIEKYKEHLSHWIAERRLEVSLHRELRTWNPKINGIINGVPNYSRAPIKMQYSSPVNIQRPRPPHIQRTRSSSYTAGQLHHFKLNAARPRLQILNKPSGARGHGPSAGPLPRHQHLHAACQCVTPTQPAASRKP